MISHESSSVSEKIRGSPLASKKIPVFLRRIYNLLQNNDMPDVVDWSADGENFVIKKPREFAEQLLPQMFNHGNLASFIRQLNMYSFVKVKDETHQHAYSHRFFKKDREDLIHQIERKKKYKKNIEAKKGQDQALQYQQNPSKKQELNQLLYENDILKMIKNDLTYQLETTTNEIQQMHIRNQQKYLRYEELKQESHRLQNYFISLKAMQLSTGQLKSCLPQNMYYETRAAATGFNLDQPSFFDSQNLNNQQINEMSLNLVTSLKNTSTQPGHWTTQAKISANSILGIGETTLNEINVGQPLIFGLQSAVEYKKDREPHAELTQAYPYDMKERMNAFSLDNKLGNLIQGSESNFVPDNSSTKANIARICEGQGQYFTTGMTYWAKALPENNAYAI